MQGAKFSLKLAQKVFICLSQLQVQLPVFITLFPWYLGGTDIPPKMEWENFSISIFIRRKLYAVELAVCTNARNVLQESHQQEKKKVVTNIAADSWTYSTTKKCYNGFLCAAERAHTCL